MLKIMKIIIKGDPRTKKNNQRIITNGKYPRVLPSKAFCEYEELALWQIPKVKIINWPVNVKCVYYMQTHRKVDLVNLQEGTLDILVKAGVLQDDNCSIVQSMDGSRVLYDKANPRVEITITEVMNEDSV